MLTANDLSKDAVRDAAVELMNTEGSTSSLEVKNLLRKKNFWATQSEVSQILQDIASEQGWNTTHNGTYNVYTISSSSVSSNQPKQNSNRTNVVKKKLVSIINDSVNPSSDPRVKINIDEMLRYNISHSSTTAVKNEISSKCTPKTWVAYCKTAGVVATYNEKYTSDNVRSVFARLIGEKIQLTRACRVENIENWKM